MERMKEKFNRKVVLLCVVALLVGCFSFFRGAELLESLRRTAVETLTPLEALNLLYQWKRELETEET